MRRVLLTTFIFIPFLTNAQFTKGNKVLGGTLSFFSQDAPNSQNGGLANDVKRFSVTPSLGFLIKENFGIGGQLGYASSHQVISNYSSSILEFDSKSFTIGAFGQRYFKVSDKLLFSIFGQFNFARGFDTDSDLDPLTGEVIENKTHNYELTTSIRPNFIFFPSPKWGFEASIGSISHTFSRSLSTADKANFFSINYGTITLGVSYYFRKPSNN